MAKIVTFHIPESWLEPINRLVGDKKLYPSRSELIRKAVARRLKIIIEEAKDNMRPKHNLMPTPNESEKDHLKRLVRETLEESKEKIPKNQ